MKSTSERIIKVLEQIEKASPDSDLFVSLDDLMTVIKSTEVEMEVRYH